MKVRRLSNEPALQKNQVKRKKVHFIFYRCEGKTERNKQKKVICLCRWALILMIERWPSNVKSHRLTSAVEMTISSRSPSSLDSLESIQLRITVSPSAVSTSDSITGSFWYRIQVVQSWEWRWRRKIGPKCKNTLFLLICSHIINIYK